MWHTVNEHAFALVPYNYKQKSNITESWGRVIQEGDMCNLDLQFPLKTPIRLQISEVSTKHETGNQ